MAAAEGLPGSADEKLAARVAAGDADALAEAYDRHGSFVHGLALRVTCDAAAAEEITHDVFVAFWQRPDLFDPARGSLRAWLGTTTHHRSVDRVRVEDGSRGRRPGDARAGTDGVTAAAEATATLAAGWLRAAIDSLPEDQRAAIQLAYVEGRTYREVAGLLGVPEDTARSQLQLGMRKLAEAMGSAGVAPWS